MSELCAKKCNLCNKPMVLRSGKFGPFYGCSGFPRCKGVAKVDKNNVIAKQWDNKKKQSEAEAQSQVVRKPAKDCDVLNLSVEQENIWQATKNLDRHIVVKALAGTGKSTTGRQIMIRLLKENPKLKILYLAFNTEIKNDFDRNPNTPIECSIMTLNAYGYRSVKETYRTAQLDSRKYQKLWEHNVSPKDDKETKEYHQAKQSANQIVNLLQSNLMDPTNENIDHIVDHFDINLGVYEGTRMYEAIRVIWEKGLKDTETITFTEQMYYLHHFNLKTKDKFHFLVIDEAQDLNPLQHWLIKHSIKEFVDDSGKQVSTKIMMVGDSNQAINQFRGADILSMQKMQDILEATNTPVAEMPLEFCRRCAKNIIKKAQNYVPEIKALDNAEDGEVIEITDKVAVKDELIKNGDMVICRANMPLVKLFYKLALNPKVNVVFLGKELADQMIRLIGSLECNIYNLDDKLSSYASEEMRKLKVQELSGKNVDGKRATLNDRIECLEFIYKRKNPNTKKPFTDIDELCAFITERFGVDKSSTDRVTLCTIHKSKGLESNNVFYWNYNFSSSKATKEWQMECEQNLAYVAITRAKKALYMVFVKDRNAQIEKENEYAPEEGPDLERIGGK